MVFDKFIMNMIYIWLFLKIMIGFHNDEVKKKTTNNLFNIDVIICIKYTNGKVMQRVNCRQLLTT